MNNLKIDITDIKNEAYAEKPINKVSDQVKVEFHGQTIDIYNIKVQGNITNTKTGLLLKAKADGAISLACSRCLEIFSHPLSVNIEEFYSLQRDENEELFIEDDTIDVRAALIQAIVLNLDMKTLCRKDCAGLCPKCGKNLNKEQCTCSHKPLDIRWQKLGDLKKRFNSR